MYDDRGSRDFQDQFFTIVGQNLSEEEVRTARDLLARGSWHALEPLKLKLRALNKRRYLK